MTPLFAQGNHKTVQSLLQLKKEARKENAFNVANRIHGIILSIEGRTTSEIASILKVSRTTVPLWINNWNAHKKEGLLEGFRSGRKKKLNDNQIERITDIVESGPVAYGLNTGVWTSKIIGSVINHEFDILYHPGHVRKLLKQIGFSVQRPTYKLANADPKEKNRWIRYDYPTLKKKPGQKKA
jgi:transposase